jgi:O-antigen ligase
MGAILLGLSYITLCLSERISVVFIPLGVFLAGAAWGALRWKYLVLICLVMALVVGAFHQKIIWHKFSMAYPAYRVENFPFSWSIVKQHPWLGIGLRAPREKFMQDYQTTYPAVTKEQFARFTQDIVSADNQFLTLLVGLGLPFTLTYLAALGILLARLVRLAFKPVPGLFLPPLVLLFPLTAGLVHFQLFDGLLFPQSCWFFHLLLGLIPPGGVPPATAGPRVREDLSHTPQTPIG